MSRALSLVLCDLNGASILEQRVELALLALQLAVSTNVLLRNENVGHSPLTRHISESVLDIGTVIYTNYTLAILSSQNR
jgi:hypothetical protein